MAVEFRFAHRDEYPRISKFLDEFWAKSHIYCREQALFDWTFAREGHWPSDQYSFALAEEGGTLAGILGGIPFTFNHMGAASVGIWIANYVVHPEHRRGSTALQLLSMFRRPQFHPVIAFGINPATSAIYRVLRGQVLPEIPRHFLVLPESAERMANVLRTAYPDWTAERASGLANEFTLQRLPEAGAFETKLPADWDQTDWQRIAAQTVGAARTEEFLTWRYLNHPSFDYRVIAIGSEGRHGLAIWRLETIRKQTENGREDVDKIGRLVEFLPSSDDNARELLAAFVQELRAAGAFGADHYCFHGPTRTLLQQLGFREVGTGADHHAIPARFQPLDAKGGGILSAMFVQPGVPDCSLDAACPWYWTKSDSDQDRPN